MTPEDRTNDEQERVRRLLGASGAREDMPAEVRARLDDVLAGLVAERDAAGRPTEDTAEDSAGDTDGDTDPVAGTPVLLPVSLPVSLAARRRRRWPRVLVAAAAVSALAYGAGTIGLSSMTGTGADSMGSADSAGKATQESGPGGNASAPLKREPRMGGEQTDRADRVTGGTPSGSRRRTGEAGILPRLRSQTLRRDVRAVAASASRSRLDGTFDGYLAQDRLAVRGCVSPKEAKGDRVYAVRLDGMRATLVLHPPGAGSREADLYSCDEASEPVASTTVPAS